MPNSRTPSAIRAISMHATVPRKRSVTLVRVTPLPGRRSSGSLFFSSRRRHTRCMARRKAALPSMVLTPRPSLAEFRAAPFRVNALEQDIRYRAQDREDKSDADGREPKIPIDREGQDRQPEIREHRHHAEPREHAGVEEERVGPQARE